MPVEKQVHPSADEEAERIVNARPSSKRFASLAARSTEHDRLCRDGFRANTEGAVEQATDNFVEAYALLFRRSTLQSLVNMHLKKGNVELSVACYRKMILSDTITPQEKMRLIGKLQEAIGQWEQVLEIVEASQAGRLNSPGTRDKRAATLVARAHAANDMGKFKAAEADFLEVWRLTFRTSSLISAANMMAHQEPRMRLSASIYYVLLRMELTIEERSTVERKLRDVQVAMAQLWRQEFAAKTVQRMRRGQSGRREAASQSLQHEGRCTSRGRMRFGSRKAMVPASQKHAHVRVEEKMVLGREQGGEERGWFGQKEGAEEPMQVDVGTGRAESPVTPKRGQVRVKEQTVLGGEQGGEERGWFGQKKLVKGLVKVGTGGAASSHRTQQASEPLSSDDDDLSTDAPPPRSTSSRVLGTRGSTLDKVSEQTTTRVTPREARDAAASALQRTWRGRTSAGRQLEHDQQLLPTNALEELPSDETAERLERVQRARRANELRRAGGEADGGTASVPMVSPTGAAMTSEGAVWGAMDVRRFDQSGHLRLHLVRGVGLRAADRNGKSDPYVVASTGKQKKKSHVVKRTLDPEWDEVLEFEGALRDFLSRPLLLKVYDWDQMSFNDLLGEVSVSLDELRISDSHSYRVSLSRLPTKAQNIGRLEFSVEWVPRRPWPRRAMGDALGMSSLQRCLLQCFAQKELRPRSAARDLYLSDGRCGGPEISDGRYGGPEISDGRISQASPLNSMGGRLQTARSPPRIPQRLPPRSPQKPGTPLSNSGFDFAPGTPPPLPPPLGPGVRC